MSQKVPVGEVMNEAVQFGLHRWATVLRFAWAPTVFSILLFLLFFAALFSPSFFTSMNEAADFSDLKEGMRFSVPLAIAGAAAIYLFIILLYCGVAASLFRLVALGEERPGIVQLRLDGPAFRVFFSYLIIMIISGVIWTAAIMAAMAMNGESWSSLMEGLKNFGELAAAAEQDSADELAALGALMTPFKIFGLAFLFAAIPLIYMSVKLAPFPPGSAAENRLLLFGSLSMTVGHAWSIFGVFLLYIAFVMVLSIVYGLADAVLQGLADLLTSFGSVFAIVALVMYLLLAAVAIFFQLFMMAIQYAVPAIIYRRLKTGE